jgi:hypothetical protein
MMNLIRNAMITPDGTFLISTARNDYMSHTDKNGKNYFVDGGLDYLKRSCNGDEQDMSLYDDQPHSVQREMLTWGSYGKDGNSRFTIKQISCMDTTHIESILKECNPARVLMKCMEMEIQNREFKKL